MPVYAFVRKAWDQAVWKDQKLWTRPASYLVSREGGRVQEMREVRSSDTVGQIKAKRVIISVLYQLLPT